MRNNVSEVVVEDMLYIPSLVHRIIRRKMTRARAKTREEISPLLFITMKTLEEAGTLHICEIGEKLQIPRPQMTHVIDRLVKMEIAGRKTDATDRRVINVTLTTHGKKILGEFLKKVRSNLKSDLSTLTDDELQDLSVSLIKIRDLLSKLNK